MFILNRHTLKHAFRFLFDFIIIISMILALPGFQPSPVMAISAGSLEGADSQPATAQDQEASRIHPVKINAELRDSNLAQNPYGATLVCMGGVCADGNGGPPGITVEAEYIDSADWLIIGDSGPPLLERFDFRIDCEEHVIGCTQIPVFYYTNLLYSWGSPYDRTIVNDFTTGSPDIPLQDHYATGNQIDMPCSGGNDCPYMTWGVLSANKINENEFDPETDGYHMYVSRNTTGLGVANESESVIWQVVVSFDPAVIASYLPEDAVCTSGDCSEPIVDGQHYVGKPINTRTGVMFEPVTDLSIATSAGDLSFTRTYISSNNLEEELPLGYGWSHNLAPRLIFETDPGGMPGFVLYRAPAGNTYRFWNMGDGTYDPWSGVKEKLILNNGTPVTYSVIEPDQTVYLFNESGKVINRTTPEGAVWNYIYDVNGWLDRVEADAGAHYLDLIYNSMGQLTAIADHTSRTVSYSQDASGNLINVMDVLGQIWTYEYDTAHQLLKVVDPESNQVVRNEYAQITPFDPFVIDFSKYIFKVYNNDYGQYYVNEGASVRTLQITGHASLYIPFPYPITTNTVLEFDYKSDIQSRIHGIGFDTNKYLTNDTWRCMQLWGTVNYGNGTYKTYDTYAPEWHHYVIPIGTHYTGQQANLFFYNDDHTSPYDTTSYYRDVKVYESTGVNPIHFDSSALSNYGSQDGTHTMTIEDGDLTLHLTGNTWKKMPINYHVTDNTVLEFDFKSDVQGEIQGIGFDRDNTAETYRIFMLYGSDAYNVHLEYDNYDSMAPGWKHYIIPIGKYYKNEHMYLFFTNDQDDTTPPTASSYFSNVRIYENDQKAVNQYDGEDNLIVALTYNDDGTTSIEDALGNISTDTYNDAGVLINSEDALGHDTSNAYNAKFRPTSITTPNNQTTTLAWSGDGVNLHSVSDALNNRTDFTYDELNNLTSVTDALDHVTTYTYNTYTGNGKRLILMTDALSNHTSFTYTDTGLVETVTDPLNRVISFSYNSYGQRTSMTDPEENTWSYSYDDLGRLIDATDPLGYITHNEYDASGNLTRVTRNYNTAKSQNEDNVWNIITEYEYDVRGRQVSITDTYDHTTSYTYDDEGRLLTTTDADNNVTTNVYNTAGQLVSITDALNQTTSYEYNELGRVVTVTDALNNHTHTSYNPDGTVATTTDALGKVTSYTYDELGRTTMVTDPLGNHTHTSYDALGNVATTTDARDNVTHYTYDDLGRLTHTTDPLSGVTQTIYDDAGQQIQTIDARGNSTWYTYDDAGRLLTVTDDLSHVTTYEYDELGRKISVTDARGGVTSYTYDALDRVIAVTDPLGHSSTTVYDAFGRVISSTDANGNPTNYTYDLLGRLLTQTDAESDMTEYTYDDLGNRLTITDPNDHTTNTAYDALNRAVTVTDPNGHATTTAYNANGNVTSVTDPLSHTTSFTYDDLGRQVSASDPLGNTTESVYDADGNRTQLIAPDDTVTKYEYDAIGRLTAVVENYRPGLTPTVEINVRTEYTYDATGNRLTILDGNGHTTDFTYDDLNRLVVESDALDHTWSSTYDNVGNRASLTDAKNVTTNYTYDLAGRLTLIDYPAPQVDTSFTYDDGGRPLTMTDGQGTTTWSYDDVNRILAITDLFDDTVTYSYDDAGNKIGLTYPDAKAVSYTYDAANRLTMVTDWDSQAVTYTWNDANALLTVDRPNGVDSAYSYDIAGRLTQIDHSDATKTLARFTYTYNSIGNRTAVTESLHIGQPNENITTIAYTYDPLSRLTHADYSNATDYAYTYDTVGNRLTQAVGTTTTAYAYDDANRMTAVNGVTHTWDNNGNLINDGASTYAYDVENRLTSITTGTETSSYTYNGLGDRLSQSVDGVTTEYALDLNAGLTQVLSDAENTYFYGLSRLGQEATDKEYFLGDVLGSVRQMVDSAGDVTLEISYTPFGEVLSSSGSGASIYGYSGEVTDENGLVYLRARYYLPESGRFVTRDTWFGNYNHPFSMNKYVYSYNDSSTYTDPSGHSAWVGEGGGSIGEAEYNTQINEQLYCQAGNSIYCPYAINHPVDTIVSIGVGLVAAGYSAAIVAPPPLWKVVKAGGWSCSFISALCADGNCTNEISGGYQTAYSVWNLSPFARGVSIENMLGRSPQLAQNYPVIDRWFNGTATSIKSIDLMAISYQNLATMSRTIQYYIDTLAKWSGGTWANTTIRPEQIIYKELILSIPPNISNAQLFLLQKLQEYASGKGVNLIIEIIK
jgi:RHS repeat-associated protein